MGGEGRDITLSNQEACLMLELVQLASDPGDVPVDQVELAAKLMAKLRGLRKSGGRLHLEGEEPYHLYSIIDAMAQVAIGSPRERQCRKLLSLVEELDLGLVMKTRTSGNPS